LRHYLKKPFTKIRLVEWQKVKAPSSSPSSAKKKKKKKKSIGLLLLLGALEKPGCGVLSDLGFATFPVSGRSIHLTHSHARMEQRGQDQPLWDGVH
jgi:hypothetical protein